MSNASLYSDPEVLCELAKKLPLEVPDIELIIPHRHPFLLIDRVVELVDNERVVAIKNVSFGESFFNGHFPGRPVLPGVIMIEAMAQTGAILAKLSKDGVAPNKVVLLVGVDDVKFKRQVIPGDTLRIEMTSVRKRRPLWIMSGRATVGDALAASATISAMEVA
ncbi:MAG: 3-hydroxyacyl-ACP dehydratase FabZ [Bdellovibrionota bacterium]|nr:MAG: 3-hydroxyacyl-ACP dehydratase FabZ [Bdellovibrionota bacterium]